MGASNFPVKCAARTTLLVVWCLFGEELFLAPFGYQEAGVVCDWSGIVESSDVEEHYCCIMQLNTTAIGTEGRLSS